MLTLPVCTCFVLPDQNRRSFKPCVCLDLVFLKPVPRVAHFVFFVFLLLLFGTVPHFSCSGWSLSYGEVGSLSARKAKCRTAARPTACVHSGPAYSLCTQRPGLQPVYTAARPTACVWMPDSGPAYSLCTQRPGLQPVYTAARPTACVWMPDDGGSPKFNRFLPATVSAVADPLHSRGYNVGSGEGDERSRLTRASLWY